MESNDDWKNLDFRFFDDHKSLMEKIQKEWEDNREYHEERRATLFGIRSSQISALVMVLLKEGLIEIRPPAHDDGATSE